MNIDWFMDQIIRYYGDYPEKMKRVKTMTIGYLKGFKEARLPDLLQLVCMNHSFNYGPPDVAAIEKAYDYALKNGKCGDLKKSRIVTFYETAEKPPTDKELAETKKLIEKSGCKTWNEYVLKITEDKKSQ